MLEIFNQSVLYDKSKDKIFVVESAIDALSLIKCGADAIALNSTGNAERLIERLQKRPARAILLLALDNDDAGRKPLRTIGMPFLTVFPSWKEILTVIFPLSAIIFVNIVFVDFDAVYGNEKEKFREEVGRRRKAVIGLSGLSALEKRLSFDI